MNEIQRQYCGSKGGKGNIIMCYKYKIFFSYWDILIRYFLEETFLDLP